MINSFNIFLIVLYITSLSSVISSQNETTETTLISLLNETTPISLLNETTPISLLNETTPISLLNKTTPISLLEETTTTPNFNISVSRIDKSLESIDKNIKRLVFHLTKQILLMVYNLPENNKSNIKMIRRKGLELVISNLDNIWSILDNNKINKVNKDKIDKLIEEVSELNNIPVTIDDFSSS